MPSTVDFSIVSLYGFCLVVVVQGFAIQHPRSDHQTRENTDFPQWIECVSFGVYLIHCTRSLGMVVWQCIQFTSANVLCVFYMRSRCFWFLLSACIAVPGCSTPFQCHFHQCLQICQHFLRRCRLPGQSLPIEIMLTLFGAIY